MKINQTVIDRSLNSAVSNGYELDEPAINIAEDLHEYDAQFENVEPKILQPFVEDWMRRRS